MQHFIVIGSPIAHSKSPQLHHAFAEQVNIDVQYRKQFCPDNEASFFALVEAFFNGGGKGANVTVPFKQLAYKICSQNTDNLTAYAKVAGAVNTLYLDKGKIYGHNTDGLGLVNHLKQLGWLADDTSLSNPDIKASPIKKIAIIGAGGASRGIILPLILAGVEQLHVANRTVNKAEELISDCQTSFDDISHSVDVDLSKVTFSSSSVQALTGHYDLIINATSIGLSGEELPLSEQLNCNYSYDMMYGRELPFLQFFEAQGSQTSDGYGMLLNQAVLSFELWTNKKIQVEALPSI